MLKYVISLKDYDANVAEATCIFNDIVGISGVLVKDGIRDFYKRTGFDPNYLDGRNAHHEIAHVISNATSGSLFDEGLATIYEVALNKGSFQMRNSAEEYFPDFGLLPIEFLSGHNTSPDISTVRDIVEAREKQTIEEFWPEQIKKGKVTAERASKLTAGKISDKSNETLESIYDKALQTDELLQAVTGARKLIQLSSQETLELNIEFLGVRPVLGRKYLSFEPHPEEKRIALLEAIRAKYSADEPIPDEYARVF